MTECNFELGVRNFELGVRNFELGVRNLQFGVRNLQFGEDGGMEAHEKHLAHPSDAEHPSDAGRSADAGRTSHGEDQPEQEGQGATGLGAVRVFVVTADDTAAAVGSGSLAVLGTPRLLAWCEAVTCEAIEPLLTPGRTSVGTRVALEHLAASKVGAEVEVSVSATYTEPKLVRFTVAARMGAKLVASGEVTRVVVDAERFLARLR